MVGFLIDENVPDAVAAVPSVQEAARMLGLQLVLLKARTASDIDAAFATLKRERAAALVVGTGALLTNRRKQIITLAAQEALPAIYPFRYYVVDGGLVSYGPDTLDQFRRAAAYVDRILKGEKPGDLPVQAPARYDLVINLKTARALGLDVPHTLLARADEVIE